MLKNWKTTLAGLIPAVALIVYKLITHEPILIDDITLVISSIGIGAVAKDSDVTGGTREQ